MSFINEDFMLQTETAKRLYHERAEKMPIIDYHCHLVPQQIAENIQFRDITQRQVQRLGDLPEMGRDSPLHYAQPPVPLDAPGA